MHFADRIMNTDTRKAHGKTGCEFISGTITNGIFGLSQKNHGEGYFTYCKKMSKKINRLKHQASWGFDQVLFSVGLIFMILLHQVIVMCDLSAF